MLVLTRRVGESIKIDCDIQVSVLAIQGNQVRLGLIAPAAIHVTRAELGGEQNGFQKPNSKSAGTPDGS